MASILAENRAKLYSLLAENRAEIQVVRRATKCCVRCAMRYAEVRDPAAYQLSEEELEAAIADDPEADADATTATDSTAVATDVSVSGNSGAVCPLCLGCLQHCVRPEAVSAVAEVVRSSGHEMREFALVVSVPVQVLLRERGGWLNLQRARAASAAVLGGGFSSIAPTRGGAPPAARGNVGQPRYDKIVDLKEALRWSMAPALSHELGVPCEGSSPLLVHVSLSHAGSAGEHHDIVSKLLPPENAHQKRKRWNNNQPTEYDSIRTVSRALAMERADNLISSSRMCPPPNPTSACLVTVNVERSNVTLTGRYCKYSRQLPQSPWILDGSRKAQGSVQECITEIVLPLYGAAEGRFHSAGREDVDVRMLGNGRPFTLELVGPKRPWHDAAALARAVEEVNACGLIEIDGLTECDLSRMSEVMKEGEEGHRKEYRCCVILSRALAAADVAMLNGTTELVCQQLTPMRVLHRRTLMVRERTIHSMRAVLLSPKMLQLDLTTQAGTYVKEFVHGDFGRTTPTLGALLNCSADIMQLDVMGLQDMPHKQV